MTVLRFRVVDVFTTRPLAGNALCVVLDDCPADLRQRIAREVNLSETTFPRRTAERAYEMRIHTPTRELPFAGHPSIGTAWTLGPGTWTQTTPGATVTIEADDTGAVMTQPDPVVTEVDPAPLAAAVGLAGRPLRAGAVAEAAGNRFGVLAVEHEADVAAAVPDLAAIGTVAPLLAVVGLVGGTALHVRVFAPGAGIVEDPGTGAAAGPVATVARGAWGLGADLTISQGVEVGRPCRIEVHAERGRLRVGGAVAACAEGHFDLPG